MSADPRVRTLEAAVSCMGRYGIAKTTVDDVATLAGLSRATVYRYFPDGKEQVISEAITWAVGQFFSDLAEAIDDAPDFATLLERALLHAHHAVENHEVLQKVLETEPERLLPQLTQSAPMVQAAVRGYFEERLATERLRPGLDVEQAADWLSRMGLSFIISSGSWDVTDPEQVRRLVREELLVPILATPDPQADTGGDRQSRDLGH